MNPTLDELDLLEIVPYGERFIRTGDVILFKQAGAEHHTVHRIVRIAPEDIYTQGDNSTAKDPWILKAAEIRGRVVAAWRGRRRRRITGGWAGLLMSHLSRQGYALFRRICKILHPYYRALARLGIVQRFLPGSLDVRVVTFQASGCKEKLLMLGSRIVGRYNPFRHQWDIKKPYRLFVDEENLP